MNFDRILRVLTMIITTGVLDHLKNTGLGVKRFIFVVKYIKYNK